MTGCGQVPLMAVFEGGAEPGHEAVTERRDQIPDPHRPPGVVDQAFPTQHGQEERMRDGRSTLGGGDHAEQFRNCTRPEHRRPVGADVDVGGIDTTAEMVWPQARGDPVPMLAGDTARGAR